MTDNIPYGNCHCGCGQVTNIPHYNARKRGIIKGQPNRYLSGHNARKSQPVLKECETCEQPFRTTQDQRRFCCRACWQVHASIERRGGMHKECEECSATFYVAQYRSDARFCSRPCASAWALRHRSTPLRGPDITGNTFRKGLRPTNAFTSEEVRGSANPTWKEPIEFICEHCAKPFYLKPWEVRQRQKKQSAIRFCSRKCFAQAGAFQREKSVGWLGGPKTYRGRGWCEARVLAVERDKGSCQNCLKYIGDSIPVHHVHPFREYQTAEAANQLDNLICLCQSCHMRQERRLEKIARLSQEHDLP